MTYPVYIGDRAAGTMTVTAAGEDHLFEVICHPPEPGLWRVWVLGAGSYTPLTLSAEREGVVTCIVGPFKQNKERR